ncbi:MAG: STAS domain-containing protein [Pelagibaca sp.]
MTILVQTSSAPEIPGAATNPPPKFRSKRCAHYDLPETPDQDDLLHLQAFLADNIGSAVVISAAQVRRADTLLLQLLLAAQSDWQQRKLSFTLVDLPEAVAGVLPLLGLRPDMIGMKEMQ